MKLSYEELSKRYAAEMRRTTLLTLEVDRLTKLLMARDGRAHPHWDIKFGTCVAPPVVRQ